MIPKLLVEAQMRLDKRDSKLAYYAEQLKEEIDENTVFIEARHGDALEGNMYYIARELLSNPAYKGLEVLVSANKQHMEIVKQQAATLPGEIKIVRFGSNAYMRALARSKYLFNDTCFRPCFYKREGQVYVNTWHGTPLKYLGRPVKRERGSLGNVQRNFLCCDYLLAPNMHTHDVLLDDYMTRGLFTGKAVLGGYPRNAALLDEGLRREMREKYGLEGKRAFAFMPTYRGTRDAVDAEHVALLCDVLAEMDGLLGDDEVVYLNLHPFMAGSIDCADYERVFDFPADVPAYDFLAAVDGLVTDYSSLMFDYACTRRPIALLVPDLEEYSEGRGIYFDVSQLGFPWFRTMPDVLACMRDTRACAYEPAIERFCQYDSATSARDLVALAIQDTVAAGSIKMLDQQQSALPTALVRIEGIEPSSIVDMLARYFQDPELEKYQYFVTFARNNPQAELILDAIPKKVGYFAVGGTPVLSKEERAVSRLFHAGVFVRAGEYCASSAAFVAREWSRRYGNAAFDRVVDLGVYNQIDAEILSAQPNCELVLAKAYSTDAPAAQPSVDEIEALLLRGANVMVAPDWLEEHLSPPDPEAGIRAALIAPRFSARGASLGLKSLMAVSAEYPQRVADARLQVGGKDYDIALAPLHGKRDTLSGVRLCRFSVKIPADSMGDLGEENRIALVFGRGGEVTCRRAITYRALRKEYKVLHGPLLRLDAGASLGASTAASPVERVAFFRQTRKNTLILTIRGANVTDRPMQKAKLACAWLVAQVPVRNRPVLMYEKNASSYAESGKAVYEHLCAQGVRNVRFVLPKAKACGLLDLPRACRKRIVYAHTFAHYLAFFRARTFIGTELPLHALERGALSRKAQEHVNGKDRLFVFLQHGVMYMVSLDAFQREFFRRESFGCKTLVSVNSEKELRHFVDLGNYSADEMLLSGLAKFDSAYQDEDADIILIMPTWRPWEMSGVAQDRAQTGYWKLVETLRKAVPENLQDKVVVRAHPLFESMCSGDVRFSSDASTEELLRKTKVLVTDYSSIAYDAFYRGANVVFYWAELEECMARYGDGAHLMIDDATAPGFVCRKASELSAAIRKAYENAQPEAHKVNFESIVQFHDGCNTERLAVMLEERGVIQRK